MVSRPRVLGHDKEKSLLSALVPLLLRSEPALVAENEVVLVLKCGIFVCTFYELVSVPDDRSLYDPSVDSLTKRRVANDVAKDIALAVLGSGGQVELGDQASSAATRSPVKKRDRIVPGRIWVPNVVRFVIKNHEPGVGCNAVSKLLRCVEGLRLRDGWAHEVVGLSRFLARARVIEAVDVRKVDDTAGGGAGRLVLKNCRDVPVAAPGQRNQRIGLEDLPVGEILLKALKNSDSGRYDYEVPGHRGVRLAKRVEVAPHDRKAHDLGLARACGHLEGVAWPEILVGSNSKRSDFAVRASELSS